MSTQGEAVSASESSESTVQIFVSIEMSRAKWVIGVHTPLADKIAIHGVAAGDADAVAALIERLRSRIVTAQGSNPSVLCCHEAGYEGFWLQRRFAALGIRVIVIDPASLLVNRRAKRAKTDRIDARAMVRALMAHARGEHQVLSAVRVPTVEQDDERRLLRERQRLIKERTAHTNRIKGLLKTQGIAEFNPRAADATQRLDGLITGDGRHLGCRLKEEIVRELQRLALAMEQLVQVEAERDRVIREAKVQLEEPTADCRRDGAMLVALNRLKGIGANDASMLVREAFWRDFRNRRELGGWSGLAPAPWASGAVVRDQGITKAGPPLLRAQMIQITWRWVLWQPGSRLAQWFTERTAGATGRLRRVMVVALARKLLVALWRYATTGLVPEGAIVT